MQQNSTLDLLIKHLYQETDTDENAIVQQLLASDTKLQEQYQQLCATKNAIDEHGGDGPNDTIIQQVLSYSQQKEHSITY